MDSIASYFYPEDNINNIDIDKLVPALAEHLVNSNVKDPLVIIYRVQPEIHYR